MSNLRWINFEVVRIYGLITRGGEFFSNFSQLFKSDWKFHENQPNEFTVQSIVKREAKLKKRK